MDERDRIISTLNRMTGLGIDVAREVVDGIVTLAVNAALRDRLEAAKRQQAGPVNYVTGLTGSTGGGPLREATETLDAIDTVAKARGFSTSPTSLLETIENLAAEGLRRIKAPKPSVFHGTTTDPAYVAAQQDENARVKEAINYPGKGPGTIRFYTASGEVARLRGALRAIIDTATSSKPNVHSRLDALTEMCRLAGEALLNGGEQ